MKLGIKISGIDTGQFFTTEKVMKALSDAERKTLSKFGAFVRQTAKTSMRPAVVLNKKEVRLAKKYGTSVKKVYQPSQPGEPPRTRAGDLRKLILFGYDSDARSVVVGPLLRGGKASATPARLEFGGTFTAKNGRKITVLKRPYMQPAFNKELAKMPALFLNSMKG